VAPTVSAPTRSRAGGAAAYQREQLAGLFARSPYATIWELNERFHVEKR
jgi:hypothetical protein